MAQAVISTVQKMKDRVASSAVSTAGTAASTTGFISAFTKFEDASFPFHAPNLRLPEPPVPGGDPWDVDVFGPDTGATLIPSEDFKNNNLGALLTDDKVPILAFTPRCYREIQYLFEIFPHQEWAVFLTMKRLSLKHPHFLAFDWFMPGQEATSGTVNMQHKDAVKYYEYLMKTYPEYYRDSRTLHNNLCHLHSHHSLGLANFSGTDDKQQFGRDDLGYMGDYRFYIVGLNDGRLKAVMVTYNPVLARIPAAVALDLSHPGNLDTLTKARKAEIEKIASDAMWRKRVAASTGISGLNAKSGVTRSYAGKTEGSSYSWDYWKSYYDYPSEYPGYGDDLSDNISGAHTREEPDMYDASVLNQRRVLKILGHVFKMIMASDPLDETWDPSKNTAFLSYTSKEYLKSENNFQFTLQSQEERDGLLLLVNYVFSKQLTNNCLPIDLVMQMAFFIENGRVIRMTGIDEVMLDNQCLCTPDLLSGLAELPIGESPEKSAQNLLPDFIDMFELN